MVLGPWGLYYKHMIIKVTLQLEHHSAMIVIDDSCGINYNLDSSIMIVIMSIAQATDQTIKNNLYQP